MVMQSETCLRFVFTTVVHLLSMPYDSSRCQLTVFFCFLLFLLFFSEIHPARFLCYLCAPLHSCPPLRVNLRLHLRQQSVHLRCDDLALDALHLLAELGRGAAYLKIERLEFPICLPQIFNSPAEVVKGPEVHVLALDAHLVLRVTGCAEDAFSCPGLKINFQKRCVKHPLFFVCGHKDTKIFYIYTNFARKNIARRWVITLFCKTGHKTTIFFIGGVAFVGFFRTFAVSNDSCAVSTNLKNNLYIRVALLVKVRRPNFLHF